MATWKSENSMLTQVGVEILNKVKAGIGSITVTRIVAGSGRVPASQLFQQTAVSGTAKPMTISQKGVRDSGTEISIYITNNDFTESFSLNQIGVYVSHPDYLEEQLYHISQCESTGFDVIPALDETPVTFGYSLFLEHGNSDSISITVDPQGVVLAQDFEEYKVSVENRISNLTYADVGAAPYSLIYGEASVVSKENLNSTLLGWFNSMGAQQTRHFVLNSSGGGSTLEGGTWFITIDKVGSIYGMITAKKYLSSASTPGIMIKTCSVYDGRITNWGVINSDALVPATLE